MKIRVAVVGNFSDDNLTAGKMGILFGEIMGHMKKNNPNAEVQLVVGEPYTGESWIAWNQSHRFQICACCKRKDSIFYEKTNVIRYKETPLNRLIGEEMCNISDVALVVWNEDIMESSGATWEFLQMAYQKKVPCIWYSAKSQTTYCLWESYYQAYTPQYLEKMLTVLPKNQFEPEEITEKKSSLLAYWEKKRKKYLKKYKAEIAVHEVAEDSLMNDDFTLEVPEGEKVRQLLLKKFHAFDNTAIDLNSRFHAVLYQRSVLPFIATIFLAVGFYSETLLGKTTSFAFSNIADGALFTAKILAGFGFLIHGMLNFYVNRLSKNETIKGWQENFTDNRYTAELLRSMIHFVPYGVRLDLRQLCGEKDELFAQLQHIADDCEPDSQEYTKETSILCLKHVREFLIDQLNYHKASIKRYESIVHSLEKWHGVIFVIGLTIVILRGILQFVLACYPLEKISGFDVNSVTSSFLNMLALLTPSWAGYFLTKRDLNNFRYNLNNHNQMKAQLEKILERVNRILEQKEIPMEVSERIAEELSLALLEDTSHWKYQYMNSSIKPL